MHLRFCGHFQTGIHAQMNQDSDQSISEEEGSMGGWTEHTSSLNDVGVNNEGGMLILSQLDILRDSYEHHPVNYVSVSRDERKIGPCDDDEVENPFFNDDDDSSHYPKVTSTYQSSEGILYLSTLASISNCDEEIISGNQNVRPPLPKNAGVDVRDTWSEASREVKALSNLHGNSDSFLGVTRKAKIYGRGKTKNIPKFSFNFQSSEKDKRFPSGHGYRRESLEHYPSLKSISASVHKDMDRYQAECLGCETQLLKNHIAPYELSRRHDFKEYSMAESLHHFHKKSDLSIDVEKGGRVQKVLNRYSSPLAFGCLDDDDLPEALDGEPSSDDGESHQHLEPIIKRTMADQFHEAFGTVTASDEPQQLAFPRPLCGGALFEKLQRVIHSEKKRDMDQLKVLSAEASSKVKDDRLHLTVKILSMYLEAKLTVCSCSTIWKDDDSYLNKLQKDMKSSGRALTIIFSSRVCSDVDLDVGNIICIHAPWKEIPVVEKDEVIILCSYYSQVQSYDITS